MEMKDWDWSSILLSALVALIPAVISVAVVAELGTVVTVIVSVLVWVAVFAILTHEFNAFGYNTFDSTAQ